jgi:hypothetical protein
LKLLIRDFSFWFVTPNSELRTQNFPSKIGQVPSHLHLLP